MYDIIIFQRYYTLLHSYFSILLDFKSGPWPVPDATLSCCIHVFSNHRYTLRYKPSTFMRLITIDIPYFVSPLSYCMHSFTKHRYSTKLDLIASK